MIAENAITTMIATLFSQFWWLFLLLALVWAIKLFAPTIKGRVGEGLVNLGTKLRLDPAIYHLLQDVMIPSQAGSTQIDHVIVSIFGLFVIETKNYKGWIFASAQASQWTQVNFRQKHRFQNPLHQNYAHICALAELLGIPKSKIHGVVCFMGNAKFKTPVPEGVFLDGRYLNHIQSFRTALFSKAEVASLVQHLESGRLEPSLKTNRQHVRQLNARHSASGRGSKTSRGGL